MNLTSKVIRGAVGPHLLVTGGVHGDEFEPMLAIRRVAKLIEPAHLLGQLTLVPVVNEAAYLRGQRTAEDGLDLARTCPGRPDGSITERTADALSRLIRSADFYIDLHTGGTTLCVWPLAGYMMHPNREVLEQQRRLARAFHLPVVWGTDYRLEGRSLSVARDANVPAIYCEYLGGGRCSSEGINAYVTGMLNVMGILGMIDHVSTEQVPRYFVEDDRPSSGHMQICNLAPTSGLFEPSVRLGEWVEVGQNLGSIADVTGDRIVTVTSQQRGVVIVLRTFPRVCEGDSLAVVMETEPVG